MNNAGQKYKTGDVTKQWALTAVSYGRFEFVGECMILYCHQSYAAQDWYVACWFAVDGPDGKRWRSDSTKWW